MLGRLAVLKWICSVPIKKVTTLTYQDFQPENLVGGGLRISFNKDRSWKFLVTSEALTTEDSDAFYFQTIPNSQILAKTLLLVPNTLLSCSCNPWPYEPPPPPKKKQALPCSKGAGVGGGRGESWTQTMGGKRRGRRGGLTSTAVQGLAREAAERVTARVGRKRAWLVWGRARLHGGGVRGGPGRCRGDCDECEGNAGSAARGQKGETAKERLRRQTEPS